MAHSMLRLGGTNEVLIERNATLNIPSCVRTAFSMACTRRCLPCRTSKLFWVEAEVGGRWTAEACLPYVLYCIGLHLEAALNIRQSFQSLLYPVGFWSQGCQLVFDVGNTLVGATRGSWVHKPNLEPFVIDILRRREFSGVRGEGLGRVESIREPV